MQNLLQTRFVSFGYSLLSVIITAVLGVLVSDDVRNIIMEHFGEGTTGTIILLLITEAVKHVRNIQVVGKLGSKEGKVII